ncbi:MAG TPA: hypothetical protein VGB11_07795 [Candidatus Bathyarchaeia archaeon]|jgi:hypothetical protein
MIKITLAEALAVAENALAIFASRNIQIIFAVKYYAYELQINNKAKASKEARMSDLS